MYRGCIFLFAMSIMTFLVVRENYVYFKKIYTDFLSPAESSWRVDVVDERLMGDSEEDELLAMERMAMLFMLCVSSVVVCWNLNHYRRKDEKEEYESKLDSMEKRFQGRLQILEDKFADLKREFAYSCKNIEMIYSREETVLSQISATTTSDACHQMGTEGPGVEQSVQTKSLNTKDSTQQTTSVIEADDKNDSSQMAHWNSVGNPGTGDPRVGSANSWYEETQKEEQELLAGQDTCSMNSVDEFVNDPAALELEVTECLDAEDGDSHLAYNLDQGIVIDVCKMNSEMGDLELTNLTNEEKISPREEVFEEVNYKNNLRRIPQYQGLKKGNPKLNNTRHVIGEDNSPPFVFPKSSERSEMGRHSRPSTPRVYSPPEGVELNQGSPNRRRKPRNFNAK